MINNCFSCLSWFVHPDYMVYNKLIFYEERRQSRLWQGRYHFLRGGGESICDQNGQHLVECEKTDCSPKYFKCPGFYCIPLRYVCNGIWECPGGMEELPHMNCHLQTCSGLFKCLDSLICIAPESICDGIIDCPHGDDIQFCDMNLAVCPRSCTCFKMSLHFSHLWSVGQKGFLSDFKKMVY